MDNQLLCTLQSGYRKHCSTTTVLIKIENDIRCALDRKLVTVLVLLNFSKAFDSISHNLLCTKLKNLFSLGNSAIKLIYLYLSGRSQYVEFDNAESDLSAVTSGVYK